MAITFRVNLETVNRYASKQPYTSEEADNFADTRSTWFPDLIRRNRKLQDGDTFEESGMRAIYLRDNFTSGEFKFLDEVSGTP